MTRPSTTYMTPIRLWSTEVIHSRHRYGHQPFTVMVRRTARMTMTTAAPAISGRGSFNGIAAQLSLPSMSTSCLTPWPRGSPSTRFSGPRHRPVDDALEQLRFYRAIGSRRHGLARLCQLGIAGLVQGGSGAARLFEPGVEIAGRHRLDDEPHLGKAVAAVICGEAGILARLVRKQVEVRGHAAHRVDLAAELRYEERIHHCRRGEPKRDGSSGRDDQLIDGGDALIGIDEQPFPIERHDVDVERVGFPRDRRAWIELMGTDPNDPAEQDHGQRRDRPDDELDTLLVRFIRAVAGTGIG